MSVSADEAREVIADYARADDMTTEQIRTAFERVLRTHA